MPVPSSEAPATENPDLEAGPLGAKLVAVEVAKHLRVHPTTVYRMAKRGELPGFKIGSDWRFDRAQIEESMKSRMQGGEA
jgi:excisionase family DNA binding protein